MHALLARPVLLRALSTLFALLVFGMSSLPLMYVLFVAVWFLLSFICSPHGVLCLISLFVMIHIVVPIIFVYVLLIVLF